MQSNIMAGPEEKWVEKERFNGANEVVGAITGALALVTNEYHNGDPGLGAAAFFAGGSAGASAHSNVEGGKKWSDKDTAVLVADTALGAAKWGFKELAKSAATDPAKAAAKAAGKEVVDTLVPGAGILIDIGDVVFKAGYDGMKAGALREFAHDDVQALAKFQEFQEEKVTEAEAATSADEVADCLMDWVDFSAQNPPPEGKLMVIGRAIFVGAVRSAVFLAVSGAIAGSSVGTAALPGAIVGAVAGAAAASVAHASFMAIVNIRLQHYREKPMAAELDKDSMRKLRRLYYVLFFRKMADPLYRMLKDSPSPPAALVPFAVQVTQLLEASLVMKNERSVQAKLLEEMKKQGIGPCDSWTELFHRMKQFLEEHSCKCMCEALAAHHKVSWVSGYSVFEENVCKAPGRQECDFDCSGR